MSKVARAKKMFDDVSSDADSKGSNAAAATPPRTAAAAAGAQHADPNVETPQAGDANAFPPKSASASQPRAEHQADSQDAADAGATMVTRVEVSPPPKEARETKVTQSPAPLRASATAHTSTAQAGTTPAKSTAARHAGLGASGVSSSYSTPATVSKRPLEREEQQHQAREEGGNGQGDSTVRKEKRRASATRNARYKEREEVQQDGAAFSTMANRAESRTTRRGREEEEGEGTEMQKAPYSATSGRSATAAQLEYSREEPSDQNHNGHAALLGRETTDDESEVEDFPFASYVFPRLDPALADYHGSRTAVGAAKRGEECPPNACERSMAYLMVTDLSMAIYMGILLLSLVFVIVSIPTSQLDLVGKACYTYWGFKDNCDSATYTQTRPVLTNSAIRSRLGAGAAFSIITLIIYVVNLTATMIAICCLKSSPHKISRTSRVVVATVGGVLVVTQLISWAVIAGIHTSHYGREKGEMAFGVGFGLNLTSWILNVLGVVLVAAVPPRLINRHQRS